MKAELRSQLLNLGFLGSENLKMQVYIQYSLRTRMEKISLAMSECHQRWTEIESLCGFPVVPTSVSAGNILIDLIYRCLNFM